MRPRRKARWHIKGFVAGAALTRHLERGWEPFAVTGRTIWIRKHDWRKQP